MRAFLDANVYISSLLSPTTKTPPTLIVQAALDGAYALLVSQTVLTEFRARTASKPYLAARIPGAAAHELAVLVAEVAEVVPEILENLPPIGRDRDDDYLIAHALIGRADYLVSGDNDLLSLGQVETLRIVSPTQFLAILNDSGGLRDITRRHP